MAVTRTIAVTDGARAELCQGLGRALSAGLPAAQALDALAGIAGGALDVPLRRAADAARRGSAVPLALSRQGLLPQRDVALLTAAHANGVLDRVCERLAARYARSHARWRQLRGRLLLPAAVLVVAVIVLPLPALAAGDLGVAGYATQTGAALALLGVLAVAARRLVRRSRAAGTPGWLTRAARLLPGMARLSRLHQRADACERLALASASGMPVDEALAAMRDAETGAVRRAALVAAQRALGGGAGVAGALRQAGLLDAPGYAIVAAGEAAGRLDDTLERVAAGCHDALDDAYALLAQWIPVVLYVMVAGVVAVGLLG